jgi:hypothetical protein
VAFRLRRRIAGKGAKSDGKRFSGIMRRDICSSLRLRKGNGRPAWVFNSWALRGTNRGRNGSTTPSKSHQGSGQRASMATIPARPRRTGREEAVSLGLFCQNAIRGCIRQSSPQWWRFGPFHLTQKFARLFFVAYLGRYHAHRPIYSLPLNHQERHIHHSFTMILRA